MVCVGLTCAMAVAGLLAVLVVADARVSAPIRRAVELVELRNAFEGGALIRLAKHHTDEDLAVLQASVDELRAAVGTIRALSPQRTLQRGYAVLVDDAHGSVSSVADTAPGERIQAYLSDGELTLDVVSVARKEAPRG